MEQSTSVLQTGKPGRCDYPKNSIKRPRINFWQPKRVRLLEKGRLLSLHLDIPKLQTVNLVKCALKELT